LYQNNSGPNNPGIKQLAPLPGLALVGNVRFWQQAAITSTEPILAATPMSAVTSAFSRN